MGGWRVNCKASEKKGGTKADECTQMQHGQVQILSKHSSKPRGGEVARTQV